VAAESNETSSGDKMHVYRRQDGLSDRKKRSRPAHMRLTNGSTRQPLRDCLSKLRGSKGVTGDKTAEKQHTAARKGKKKSKH
jgi:hypothetical protein